MSPIFTPPHFAFRALKSILFGVLFLMSFSVFSQNPTVINDSLIVNQRLYAKEKLVVDLEAKFKQDIKVLGTARLNGDVDVDGTAKFHGNVKMDGLGLATSFTDSTQVLILLPNGQLKSGTISALMGGGPPPDLNFCGANGGVPKWWASANALYTGCPDVNVGIATNSPIHKLHVSSGNIFGQALLTGNSNATVNALYNGFSQSATQDLIQLGIKFGSDLQILRFNITNKGAVTVNNGGNQPSMTIQNGSGHALVIYNNGGTKILQVENNGLLRTRELRIDATTWADFVFEESYDLPELNQVAAFIEENHRLPGVPSSEEIKENGINVAEMHTLQMQKIEELTLYMIEMNQKMEELQSEVSRLKQENQELKKSDTK
ncbi:MAG: hypothetical protein JNJ99_12605 [Crocinitomicaceae bacterium]|nr:hypothetical protein [Crocinitomicaceae bacterium]